MISVLTLPGALRAFIPALIGRLAFAMVGLAVLLAAHESTGSFTIAGLVTAVVGITNVLASPWRARAVDRWGQRRVLPLLAIGEVVSLVAFAALAASSTPPVAALLALSAVIGLALPPLGAAMRVIWSSLTEPGAQRKSAFSLDATCEELLFVAGPVIAAALATAASPSVGIIVAAACAAVGTLGLAFSSASQQLPRAHGRPRREDQPLRQPGFLRVLIGLTGIGLVLGVIEVFAPAHAAAHDAVNMSGWLLAAFAAGSAIGGVIYGALPLRSSLTARLTVLIITLSATVAALPLAPTLLLISCALFVAGLSLAPSLITGYLIADETVPQAAQTEASAWINTVVNLGASVGAGVAGIVIDGFSPAALLWGTAIVTLAGVLVLPRHRSPRLVE